MKKLSKGSLAPDERLSTLPEGQPELTLGWEVARWVESGLFLQPNGPRVGQTFRFTPDQLRFVLWWYAVDNDGRWLFDHGVRRLAKGSGKSPFAAVLALAEFCGPVRLASKDHRSPGGLIGKQVDLPWVQVAATAESQTYNTMRMVRAFAGKGSKLAGEYNLDVGKTQYYRLPEGRLEVITSSSTSAEGAEASFIVADETEHWLPGNGGPELMSTLADNLAKSGNRLLETSNAWRPDMDSVAEAAWDAWVAEQEGRLREESSRTLYDARMAPPGIDLSDYESLKAGLEWVYGDCEWKRGQDGEIDVAPVIGRIWDPKADLSDSKRKYLNWPTAAEDSWVTPSDWWKLSGAREITVEEPVVMFFDGSKSRDATALVCCAVEDGYVFVPKGVDGLPTIWEPDQTKPDDVVPVELVDLAVKHVAERLNVVAFFADVQEWESFTKISWPKELGEQLKITATPSRKDPQLIAWDMRSHTKDFTLAVELAEQEILAGLFSHDGNPALGRHVANARRRPNRWGVSIGKESRSSAKKIDAAVCMIGARMVRNRFLAEGVTLDEGRTGEVW